MKLEKAIELLSIFRDEGMIDLDEDLDDAQKLGIEALKRIKAVREGKEWVYITPLPGEED